jgi:hypothetical protein
MQPISPKNIWLEIEENLDSELLPSRPEMEKRLLYLLRNNLIESIYQDDKEQYIIIAGNDNRCLEH